MPQQAKQFLDFGPFRLDPAERVLLRDHQPVHLTPKEIETLLVLVGSAGHIVGKDELMRVVWPDTFVEEGNLSVIVFALRKVLGEPAQGHTYIETVPKRGYRFVAAVKPTLEGQDADPEASENVGPQFINGRQDEVQAPVAVVQATTNPRPRSTIRLLLWLVAIAVVALTAAISSLRTHAWRGWLGGRATSRAIQAIAVLPLDNLSTDPSQDYFADGMTEALITDLAQLRALRVISRTSVMQYKGARKPVPQIGQELNVDAVVEGAVVRAGERVRITVQLIDARKDGHLWAGSYERDLPNVLELQREVARDIASQIQMNLTPQERERLSSAPPVNPAAYEAYLKGGYYLHKRVLGSDMTKALEYSRQATELDPTYALAYSSLADSYVLMGASGLLRPAIAMPEAKKAAQRALELDDTLAEAHTSLATISAWFDWDWERSQREFMRAIEFNPGYAPARHWYAYVYLTATKQQDEGIAEMRRARELDPLSLNIRTDLGYIFYTARQYDQALEQYRSTIDLDPSFAFAYFREWQVYHQEGLFDQAITEWERELLATGQKPLAERLRRSYAQWGYKGGLRVLCDSAIQESRKGYFPPFEIAEFYMAVGETEKTLAWLEKAAVEKDPGIIYLKADPAFDGLASNSRFQDLVRRIGLPQ